MLWISLGNTQKKDMDDETEKEQKEEEVNAEAEQKWKILEQEVENEKIGD